MYDSLASAETVAHQPSDVPSLALGVLQLLLHLAADVGAVPKRPAQSPRGTLANALIDAAYREPEDRVIGSFAKVLTDAETGRWSVDQEVLAIAAQARFSLEDVYKNFTRTVRLPHGALWMEFEPCSHFGADFEAEYDRYGILFTQAPGGSLNIGFAGRRAGRTYVTQFVAQVGHDGAAVKALACCSPHEALHVVGAGERILPFILKQVTEALRLLIVCTAHRAPLIRGPLNDFTKVNKARAKHGKAAHVANQAIRWGLKPQAASTGRSNTERTATGKGGHVSNHMQRGHYKIRETGSFWWSHHFRGRAGGHPALGRDHVVSGQAAR